MGDLVCIGEFARQIDEADIGIAAQPIVDLARGTVVGYEALARFPTTNGLGVEGWFALAERAGLGPRLEATALANASALRADLPPNCFLTVNLGPAALVSAPVEAVFARAGHLGGVVVEVTEHSRIDDLSRVRAVVDDLRAAGAMIAIDDAGAGYAGLRHILDLRPDLLKVDRSLISDLDHDETKRALVSMLGVFADRADSWLLAEGIENQAELAATIDLGVPLGQGWALGHPAPPWACLDPALAAFVRSRHASTARRGSKATAATIMEVAPWTSTRDRTTEPAGDDTRPVVVLDPTQRPVTITGLGSGCESTLTRVHPDTDVAVLARRMLARPPRHRHDPVVIVDGAGRYLGLVRWERIIETLLDVHPHLSPVPQP